MYGVRSTYRMTEEPPINAIMTILEDLQDEYDLVLKEREQVTNTLHMLNMMLRDFIDSTALLHKQHHELIDELYARYNILLAGGCTRCGYSPDRA